MMKECLLLFILAVGKGLGASCDAVSMEKGTVCRCSASFCDNIENPPVFTKDEIVIYTTSNSGKRLEMEVVELEENVQVPNGAIKIRLDGSEHQKILGFGGAFTDAAAFVIGGLPVKAQEKLISSYFSRNGGARYSMGRVPIGGSDFSRKSYSLIPGSSLDEFQLQDDNGVPGRDDKLSLIQKAQAEIANTASGNLTADEMSLNIFASIWSAPVPWKTCKSPPAPSGTNSCGSGFIPWILGRPSSPTFLFGGLSADPAIRQAYAQYLVRFFEAYKSNGVSLWGLTAQNEPGGNPTGNKWDNTNYDPQDLAHFVEQYLGPAMKGAFPNVKIMVGDDQHPTIPEHAEYAHDSTFIDGVGYHWYNSMAGSLIGVGLLAGDLIGGQVEVGKAANKYSMNNRENEKFLLMTEACTGYLDNKVEPGSWERGYNYFTSILHELESGAAGWVDWNIALDMTGGPNHAGNTVDAPILVDASTGEFFKQPMYYALAHFSAFVPPGAIRLGIADTNLGFIGNDKALEVIAFRKSSSSEQCILIIANDHLTASLPARGFSAPHTASIVLPSGRKLIVEMGEHEFKTILFHCPLPQASPLSTATDSDASNSPTAYYVAGGASIGALALVGLIAFTVWTNRRNRSSISHQETTLSV